jgi:hypothetical protein
MGRIAFKYCYDAKEIMSSAYGLIGGMISIWGIVIISVMY